MEVFLLIIICVLVTGGITLFVLNKNRQYNTEKQKEMIEKTIEDEYYKKCMFIFSKCREKSILSFNTQEELENLKIIANSYGITDMEEAKRCYSKGKILVENAEKEEQNRMIIELRQRDQREFDDAQKRASIKGKEKYISYLEKIYRDALKNVDLSSDDLEDEYDKEYYKYKKDDYSIDEVYSTVLAYQSSANFNKDNIEHFNKKICDETNIEEKFKHLKFSNVKCLVLKSRNIRVSGFIKVDEDMSVLGSPALLDGSIKISVLDSNGNVLGYGYYSTGNFKDGMLINSGFTKNEKRFSAVCIIEDYEKIEEDKEYKCKIEPVNMWLIEA